MPIRVHALHVEEAPLRLHHPLAYDAQQQRPERPDDAGQLAGEAGHSQRARGNVQIGLACKGLGVLDLQGGRWEMLQIGWGWGG